MEIQTSVREIAAGRYQAVVWEIDEDGARLCLAIEEGLTPFDALQTAVASYHARLRQG